VSQIPRDFQIDPKKKDMVLKLVESEISPFYKGHRKGAANQRNVLLHAMGLAYKAGVRKPFKGGYSVFQNSILQTEEKSLIIAIAISEIGIEALFPDKTEEAYKMAEEYASSGIDIVYNMVFKAGRAEPIFDFEAEIADVLENYSE
jgi:hypothetical protein